jgi:hypothetical protein
MTRQEKTVLPTRRRAPRQAEESVFLRSAETLGRIIGMLQRQLDDATKRLTDTRGASTDSVPSPARSTKKRATRKSAAVATRRTAKTANGKPATTTARKTARKTTATAARKR